MAPGDVESAFISPDTFHFLSVLAFRLVFLYPQLLKEDVGRVEDAAGVSCICTLVAHESRKLGRLDLAWTFLCVVLGM